MLVFAGYVVLMRWVLPRLGVPTWMVGSCSVGSRRRQKPLNGAIKDGNGPSAGEGSQGH